MSSTLASNTHPLQAEHWTTKYLGLPWRNGARGPDAFDCWGLVWWVYLKELNIKLPLYSGIDALSVGLVSRTIRQETEQGSFGGKWRRLAQGQEFAGVALGLTSLLTHVGIYTEADGGYILHAGESKSVIAIKPSKILSHGFKRIEFYQYNGQNY